MAHCAHMVLVAPLRIARARQYIIVIPVTGTAMERTIDERTALAADPAVRELSKPVCTWPGACTAAAQNCESWGI